MRQLFFAVISASLSYGTVLVCCIAAAARKILESHLPESNDGPQAQAAIFILSTPLLLHRKKNPIYFSVLMPPKKHHSCRAKVFYF